MLAAPSQTIASPLGPALPYWRETRRPFCNLIFLLPLLLTYELGVGAQTDLNGATIRNGADAWLRLWMSQAGIEMAWLPPILLLGILGIWHIATRQPWKTKWDTFGGMAAESFLYAFVLIMMGQIADLGFRQANSIPFELESPSESSRLLVRLVSFMGAGIYEEFIFRLCLLPLTYACFRLVLVPRTWAILGTVVSTSLIFSLAHYLGPSSHDQALSLLSDAVVRVQSSRELWFGFAFRTLAGMFFAGLYFLRGFGITVGCHAIYDVFVGVILVHEI